MTDDDDEFFEIIDSHPMTDEEASKRLSDCSPRLLPNFDRWERESGKDYTGEHPAWILDYKEYVDTWVQLALDVGLPGKRGWTAESRKRLVDMEKHFISVVEDWL